MAKSGNSTQRSGRRKEPAAEEIRTFLEARHPRRIEPQEFKIAAVLVPIFQKGGHWHVLLTRRTQTVEHHKGEISFPGGHHDPEDASHEATALRETFEEVGVPPGQVQILGRLDDISTATGFRIRPFVGVIPYPFDFQPAPLEIAEIIILPIFKFMDPARMTMQMWKRGDKDYPVYYFKFDKYTVWGATARILKHFLDLNF